MRALWTFGVASAVREHVGVFVTAAVVPVVVCGTAVLALLAAEHRNSSRGRWLAKPVASAAFVALAWVSGALGTTYGRWIVLALIASFIGDVLLIPEHRPRWFRAGVVAFMVAHVGFIAAFLVRPIDVGAATVAALALAVALWRAWVWMRGGISPDLRGAVLTYLGVIGTMAALAVGVAAAAEGTVTLAVAALTFATSDLAVARDRFVAPGFWNRAWGLPLYYFAQLLFASSVAMPGDMP
jgi:uncharacterized membrane protein YhhN